MGDCNQISSYADALAEALSDVSDHAWGISEELGQQIDDAIYEVTDNNAPPTGEGEGDGEEDEYGEGAGVYQEDCETAQYQYDEADQAISNADIGIAAYENSNSVMQSYIATWQSNIGAAESTIASLREQFAMTEDETIGNSISALQGVISELQANIAEFEMWIGLVDQAIARLNTNKQLAEIFKTAAEEIMEICQSGNLPSEPEPQPQETYEPPTFEENNETETPEEMNAEIMASFLLKKFNDALEQENDCIHAQEEGKEIPEPDTSSWAQFNEDGYPAIFPFGPEQLEEVFGGNEDDYYEEDDYDDEFEDDNEEYEFLDDSDDLENVIDEIEADLEFHDDVQGVIDDADEEYGEDYFED